jgi:hypothetical protein
MREHGIGSVSNHRGSLEGSEERNFFVYLNTGCMVEVGPATSIRLTNLLVHVLKGEEVVATFLRQKVYFASIENDLQPWSH